MWVVYEGLLRCLISEVGVDVADVGLAAKLGHVGWRDLTSSELLPVDSLKERMCNDLLCGDALIRVTRQQASK